MAAAWFLGFALFICTLGAGYVAWSLSTWRHGQSPAQRMLRLRCWLPNARAVAGRKQMAVRQCTGFCLNGLLLAGVLVWLTSKEMRFMGDLFAGTVLLHDPDNVLTCRQNAPAIYERNT